MSEYFHLHFPIRLATGEIRGMARRIDSLTSEILEYGAISTREIELLQLMLYIANQNFESILNSEGGKVAMKNVTRTQRNDQ